MSKSQRVWLINALLVCLFSTNTFGQFPDKIKNGLVYRIDSKDTNRFVSLSMLAQLWLRNNQNNPGTTVGNTPQANTTDMSVRRLRFVFKGSLTDRLNFFVQFGQNNLNYLSQRKSGAFFHDITADYAIVKSKFSIGMGLNGWNGPSRFANSTLQYILVLDPPGYQEVTNDTYDQFVRRLGVYAKGKLGKLDYRVAAGKPFVIQTVTGVGTASASGTDPINTNTTFSTLPPHFVYQGYFMYQFLDQESNFGPSIVGSYFGNKRIFNVGGGFYYQKDAMFHYGSMAAKDTIKQPIRLFAVDVLYDCPINKSTGTAISVYACFSNYFYGSNFIKVTGPDNPASATSHTATPFQASNYGNAFPYLGTGNISYIQAAYKFKNKLLGDQGTLQPFFDLQYSAYHRLKDPMYVFDVGVNWLIHENNAKITLNYQNRPYFAPDATGALVQNSRLGELVLQLQVAF